MIQFLEKFLWIQQNGPIPLELPPKKGCRTHASLNAPLKILWASQKPKMLAAKPLVIVARTKVNANQTTCKC